MKAHKPLFLLAFLVFSPYSTGAELGKTPVPGEIIKNHSQKTDVQKKTAENQKKDGAIFSKGKTTQITPDKPTKQDKRETRSISVSPIDVNLIKLGSLDINKDWIDYIFVVFSFLLVIVGFLQWRAIHGQLRLERPWIMFRPSDPNLWPFSNPFNPNNPLLTVNWNIINVGRSPAFLTRLIARMEIVERDQTPPRLPRGPEFPNYILSPKSRPEDRHGTKLQRGITQGEYNDLQNGTRRIWVYGTAEYRGIRKRHYNTRFCCQWYVENGQAVYDPVGPPGWTEYT